MYRKIKRVWSHNEMNYIPNFRKTFPELKNVSNEEMCDRWIELGIDFYTEIETKVKWYVRLTLPFALIFVVLMTIGLPIAFMISGRWNYPLGKKSIIYNWLASLRLI